MISQQEPIGIGVLCSGRDLLGDDQNGQSILTRWGLKYMEGALEHLVNACKPGGCLHRLYKVVTVIVDDRVKDLRNSIYSVLPTIGKPWIHPLNLKDEDGLIIDRTVNIPSEFRSIAPSPEREESRLHFERGVHEWMREAGAQIILFDHYLARAVHLHHWWPKNVWNLHPGIIELSNPFCLRGKSPTRDALALAAQRAAIGEETYHGATLHHVDDEIDNGKIIYADAPTLVDPGYQPAELRWLNYQMAKLPVLIRGLIMHHAQITSEQPQFA